MQKVALIEQQIQELIKIRTQLLTVVTNGPAYYQIIELPGKTLGDNKALQDLASTRD